MPDVPNQEEDWAFSCSGVAYNTGKPSRQHFQVIRIGRDASLQPTRARDCMNDLDTELTKLGFSNEELNFDVDTTNIEDLALVVGECFQENYDQIIDNAMMERPCASSAHQFTKEVHRYVGTRGAAFIVRLVKDTAQNVRYFTLKNKENGLCELHPLPTMERNYKKFMWYSEFVIGQRIPARKSQIIHIRNTITELVQSLVDHLEGNDLTEADSMELSGLSDNDYGSDH